MNNIKFRPATLDDSFSQLARLIYQSNPALYRLWRPTESEFIQFIKPWLYADGFVFHYKNLCVATECGDRFPIALISGLDSKAKPAFNYDVFDDEASDFVVKEHISDMLSTRAILPGNETMITSFCVESAVRGYGIGQELLRYYMKRMHKRGTETFRLDCAADNCAMVQLCEKRGFRQIGEKINQFNPEKANIVTYAF